MIAAWLMRSLPTFARKRLYRAWRDRTAERLLAGDATAEEVQAFEAKKRTMRRFFRLVDTTGADDDVTVEICVIPIWEEDRSAESER